MSRAIVVELTDRCNLACPHCLPGRHGGAADLPVETLAIALAEGPALGFDRISFTGGEPTMHPAFDAILRMTCDAGFRFGLVTNGWNFAALYPWLEPYRARLSAITFSLDGATRPTHDRTRGDGSYLRLLRAFSVCTAVGLPFTINMILTRENRGELRAAAELAYQLGSRGIRFGALMPSPESVARGLVLSARESKAAEAEIRSFQRDFPFPVALAPGYHTTALFPCDPLRMNEINIDCHGYVTKCCHLSGHGPDTGSSDRASALAETGLAEAVRRLAAANESFCAQKTHRHDAGLLRDEDYFPCLYCAAAHGKAAYLRPEDGPATLVQIGAVRHGDSSC